MTRGYGSALGFSRSFMTGWAPVVEREIRIERAGRQLPASLFLPRGRARPRGKPSPVWVVLHGITRAGRAHPNLRRFARAVASGGHGVLVPEIPEWRAVELSTVAARSTVAASLAALTGRAELDTTRTGLVGFSFGAPQAIAAAADPALADRLGCVVAFGGYTSVEESLRFQFTGIHELDGARASLSPDPYGRWVAGANYLTRIPGHEDAGEVAEALRALAAYTGETQTSATDPAIEVERHRLAKELEPAERSLFEVFAPAHAHLPDPVFGLPLAQKLGRVMADTPGLSAVPYLDRVRAPVRLLHGAADQLFPYTQTLKLERAFPAGADVTSTITGLFAHSAGERRSSPVHAAREGLRLVNALADVFRQL